MPVTNDPEVVNFDIEEIVEVILSRAEGTVYAVTEFSAKEFNVIYLDDATKALYNSEENMHDHFARIHGYVNIDFTERELFTDSLFPLAERVDYLVTCMDYLKIVRIYDGRTGVFLALEPDEHVTPLGEPILEAMGKE